MSATRDAQHQTLGDSWVKLNEVTMESVSLRISEIFKKLEQAACQELERSAARFARLGTSDEHLYNSMINLMDTYRRVIELSELPNIEDHTVRTLLTGICEVLGSRYKEFQDIDFDWQNPSEKRAIISHATSSLAVTICNIGEAFVLWLQAERPDKLASLCVGALSKSSFEVEEMIAKECLPKIYSHFQETLRICLIELDGLYTCKTAELYTKIIEREWEELGNIIKVQIRALELAVSETVQPPDSGDLPTVCNILNMLRETYQQTGPVIDEFRRLLNSPPVAHPSITLDEFSNAVSHSFHFDKLEDIPDNGFFVLLFAEAAALFDQLQTEQINSINRIKRIIGVNKQLAKDVVRVFIKLKKSLQKLKFLYNTATTDESKLQYDILKAIIETIEIKIESLHDSINSFCEEGFSLLRKLSEGKISPSNDELTFAGETVRAAWLEAAPEKGGLEQFFTSVLECEVYTTFQTRVAKQAFSFVEKIEKLAFHFKKEVLLYEICTYEEILTHSVSRLRDSDYLEVTSAAMQLDSAYRKLEVILETNNIIAIRPIAHEPFNAFEHDVLVAEKQEGFSKGEIVKIINTGYKQDNKVILRANVIAAR